MTTVFANEYTKRVEAMNKEDIDKLVGETTTSGYGIARYGSLLHNNTYYWFASANNSNSLWYVRGNYGTVDGYGNNTTMGVRPKVYLVSGIRTRGRNISGDVWSEEERGRRKRRIDKRDAPWMSKKKMKNDK